MSAGRRSAWLGAAQVGEVGLQVLLPILLVRHLEPQAFAGYRLIWLIANTGAALLPFAVPHALSILLPAKSAPDRAAHVRVAFLSLGAMGALAGLATAIGLSHTAQHPALTGAVLAASLFVALWVPAVMLDYLPVADERGDWQAKAMMLLALLRTALIAWAAVTWESLVPVLYVLLANAAARLLAVIVYGQRRHRWLQARSARGHWREHMRVALPWGITGVLFSLRHQAEQWLAAAVFSATQFAAYSLAAVASPLVLLARRALSSTLLPVMARQHAGGDWAAVLATNHRANIAVACLAWPVLAFLVWFGEPIYDLIYTPQYRDAVPVMRVMALTWTIQVIELNSLLQFAGLMPRAARLNLWLLFLAVGGAVGGAAWLGLVGLAFGGPLAAFVERTLLVRMLARGTRMPVKTIQPWRQFLGLALVCLMLGGLGRLAYDWLPLPQAQWSRMLLVAPFLLFLYVLAVRRANWWPRSLAPEEGDVR